MRGVIGQGVENQTNIHRRDTETQRKTRSKARLEGAEVAEDAEGQQKEFHHGGTETQRKKGKAKAELTEVAEDTEGQGSRVSAS
jgi:hypothetical protein